MKLRPTGPIFGLTLRGMLVIMSLLAIGFAFVGTKVKRAREQKALADDIVSKGGTVQRVYHGLDANSAAVDRTWFERLTKLELDTEITNVVLQGERVTDADIAKLATLDQLGSIHLRSTNLDGTALAALKHLPHLDNLEIDSSATNEGLAAAASLPHVDSLLVSTMRWGTGRRWGTPSGASPPANFSDAGIAAIGRMANLKRLELAGPQITDESLRQLKSLPRLQVLLLNDTTISGKGLAELAEAAPHLQNLVIYHGSMTGAGFAALRQCKELSSLRIVGNPVDADGMAEIAELRQLAALDISGLTALDDDALRYIATMPGLTELHLEAPFFTDKATVHLANHPALNGLNLESRNGSFTNEALTPLATIQSLRQLSLKPDQTTTEGMDAFRRAVPGFVTKW